jgi:predicted NUDIX family phosphoesterase
MKFTGVFFGRNKNTAKCVAKHQGDLSQRQREDYQEDARLKNLKVYFYICSENQEIGSSVLK